MGGRPARALSLYLANQKEITVRDFDVERAERHAEREKALGDRLFRLGGQEFSYRANVSVDVLRRMTSSDVLSGASYIDAIEQSCIDFIEDTDDAHDRFVALMKRTDDPITMEDLQAVFQGLVEDAFRRPTQASLPSGDGDAKTGLSSTESKSTEPAVVAAA